MNQTSRSLGIAPTFKRLPCAGDETAGQAKSERLYPAHYRASDLRSAGARVAQLVEQAIENRCVTGSIPVSGTTLPFTHSRRPPETGQMRRFFAVLAPLAFGGVR